MSISKILSQHFESCYVSLRITVKHTDSTDMFSRMSYNTNVLARSTCENQNVNIYRMSSTNMIIVYHRLYSQKSIIYVLYDPLAYYPCIYIQFHKGLCHQVSVSTKVRNTDHYA